ncbi:MAG: Na+/H+ antiporter subunit E [Anaerovoracaceae bacterium]
MKFKLGNIRVNGSPLTYFVELSIFLFVLWFMLSGRTEVRFLIMGAGFSLLTSYVCAPFLTVRNEKNGREFFLLRVNIFKMLGYFVWLLKEIFFSGIEVTKIILKKSALEPRIVYFRMDYENPTAAALLATSITLTPGTITLDINDMGVYEIYALNVSCAESLLCGKMQKKIGKLYGETCEYRALPELETDHIPPDTEW